MIDLMIAIALFLLDILILLTITTVVMITGLFVGEGFFSFKVRRIQKERITSELFARAITQQAPQNAITYIWLGRCT